MTFLTHPIEAYNNEERVGRLTRRLHLADASQETGSATSAAIDVRNLHSDSRFCKYTFAAVAALTLAGACLIPSPAAKLALTPLSAWTLLLSRDQRRAQTAAARVMQTGEYKKAISWG